ncbi:hypothetical protein GPJ61_27765 [Brevibacillus formosus]|uniref:hypothetical protein n=1 Tax=Brevibacillus formosus TaxID=54913 RepID=UPI001CA5CF2A|nr:hypothetical protein [Brevibacillus formosus]MBW5471588.1 hypothetical protein [Brevibacillus formosus]
MFILAIQANTEQERIIRDTVIFRILLALSIDWRVRDKQTVFLVASDTQKEEIEKIMGAMNDAFVINLICHFERVTEEIVRFESYECVRQLC